MYRAIDPGSLPNAEVSNSGKKQYFMEGKSTLRLPSNIEYCVDNLWELCRVARFPSAPSRRKSAFASPSPSMAMESAVADSARVYKVVFPESPDKCIAVLKGVTDAKFHTDGKRIKKAINSEFYSGGLKLSVEEMVSLFTPLGISEDLNHEHLLNLLPNNHMWNDVSLLRAEDFYVEENSLCEIWFDQTDGYWLEEL